MSDRTNGPKTFEDLRFMRETSNAWSDGQGEGSGGEGRAMCGMTAAFEPTTEVRELLEGRPTEYIVVNPVAIEAEFEDGRVVRYPQDIRERVVRCRDCKNAEPMPLSFSDRLICAYLDDMAVEPEGFCAWGEER